MTKARRIKRFMEKWLKDETYQAKQKARLDKLQNNAGYKVNIEAGVKSKEANKLRKQEKRKKLAELKRRKR